MIKYLRGKLDMTMYEREHYDKGITLLAGVDEAGRGPLAGPVVACALILPRSSSITGVDDSKKISEKKREKLYELIVAEAMGVGIGCVPHDVIDKINILCATHKAMTEALAYLKPQPQHVLVDGYPVQGLCVPQTAIIKGDSKSYLIAAASIVAKVTRDRMMLRYHELYPEYGFASHKGYGTKKHIAAIEKFGLSPIHRMSFCKKIEVRDQRSINEIDTEKKSKRAICESAQDNSAPAGR